LHQALLERWKPRFSGASPKWDELKLFRSLNMASMAAALPSHGDFTPYESGRSVALWVSAFEILAHPGGTGKSGYVQVYDLLEKVDWQLSACAEEKYDPPAPMDRKKRRNLACWAYSLINKARNDYLHGNPVNENNLLVKDSKRPLLDYAPVLYRLALTGFLGLEFTEEAPDAEDAATCEAYEERKFQFQKYQQDMEAALATILKPSASS
jgi:hypothetical protein